MENLKKVIQLLSGRFDNSEQFHSLSEEEQETFPFAIHNNTILDDLIVNRPKEFDGVFLHEESYYTLKNKEKFKSDIFLFSTDESGDVVLKSITVPKELMNTKFNELNEIDFTVLSVSDKFVPLHYKEHEGTFTGESHSMFTKKTAFILKQELSDEALVIKEEMFNGDKRVFGFDRPIIYKRILSKN
ncbi:hypothetical protein BCR22_06500 [Enterococcus plantarum]|uniref:hypothetical protein n=1 Tax=Enterococcus TaxID=1350 RepID=UPI00084DAE2E|nr:hypothetical protein [Enterococcus plantarum]MBO0421684.1 hypothetical protein [Enterococcus plantarum]OEG10097.1 hypothetical protein BCR22_06500 [Enterococcus plantarum]